MGPSACTRRSIPTTHFASGPSASRDGVPRDATSSPTSTTTRWATRRRTRFACGSWPRVDCRLGDIHGVRRCLFRCAPRCERQRITEGGRAMSKLIRVIEAAARDARRAEALLNEADARRALRIDPDGALLTFELRAGAIGDETGEREERILRRDRGVRAARRNAALG